MPRHGFTFVTYIASTPDKVWKALLEPGATTQYWQHVNVSEWRPGARWEHRRDGTGGALDLVGKVIEVTPPRRLVVTWAFPVDEAVEEKHSRVSYAIDPFRDVVRLTVRHDGLEPASDREEGIVEGWPQVLSSLKSLLETGKALPKLW